MTIVLRTAALVGALAIVSTPAEAQDQAPPTTTPETDLPPTTTDTPPTTDAPTATETPPLTDAPTTTDATPATTEPAPTTNEAAEATTDVVDDADALPPSPDEDRGLETIVSRKRDLRRVAGSAHRLDEKELERFEADDINRVLKRVPGVTMREEDGFGLRPNIGMRGTSSDRSSKVVLLEDGVLFGPAPYSAPAAYYFPMMTRMVGVEVFKGPAALRHGPNTIGGALNLMTRSVQQGVFGEVDVGAGSFGTKRAHGVVGYGEGGSGVLLELAHLDSDGFKELDRLPGEPRPDTGFERNDVMLKARLGSDWTESTRHALDLKLTYGDEDSRETYLGLTDADLQATPYRRYRATAMDDMRWNRFAGQVGYSFVVDDLLDLKVTAYRHDFHRAWRRLNRFLQGPSLENVLLNPDAGQNAVFLRVLRGELDSETAGQTLGLATNDRTYYAQGVQAVGHLHSSFFDFKSTTEVGLRLHSDSITRFHTEDGLRMVSGQLTPDGRETAITTSNTASATALSAWVVEELRLGPVTVLPGTRVEIIDTSLVERTALVNDQADEATTQEDLQVALLPGVGVAVDVPFATLFGGVHRGYSPKAPGQAPEVQAETSWNVELGGRTTLKNVRAELVGFWSPYENIVGQCTLSAGCVDDGVFAQENGGAAIVAGIESALGGTYELNDRVRLNADAVYTFTHATFSTSFNSGSALFGDVLAGDFIPYVPMHQGAVTVGADFYGASVGVVASVLGEMRDLPGQGERGKDGRDVVSGETFSDTLFTLDANVGYEVWDRGVLYLRLDNLTGSDGAVSHRPFGARPTKPTSFLIGFKQKF